MTRVVAWPEVDDVCVAILARTHVMLAFARYRSSLS